YFCRSAGDFWRGKAALRAATAEVALVQARLDRFLAGDGTSNHHLPRTGLHGYVLRGPVVDLARPRHHCQDVLEGCESRRRLLGEENPAVKILVTGAAGFIASHVADAYLNAGHEVVILDDL